ncbi:hypothetical protein H310_12602 [Aphanomyces invadans]|uniref:Amino acid transporter transmembrane domain-containing protein n=1 Tax=Aphanomyces invadans TaxID=157072 RepID=A0A024TH34_9STRA|nr:hypothetical protein H310_12602 [Aphanomyces invadans]ETV93314.1 hypothetical protein H310_12602 [Aphanomyces invadans]|eukprot:XP_008877950.1 hypothetical protein H310_12602 [Aphanomyces invadans]
MPPCTSRLYSLPNMFGPGKLARWPAYVEPGYSRENPGARRCDTAVGASPVLLFRGAARQTAHHFRICVDKVQVRCPVMSKPFLTIEDMKMCFSLFCCVYGIGTLGMPGNYARAGYFWATVALVFMAAVNTYATVCMSKVMLEAPKSVRTMGDLGEFVMGCTGRWLMTVTQMMTCVLVPIAFLVLGGIMCSIMFADSYEPTTWIIIMGLSLLPVCLIPTLKEGAGAAAAGCLGTVLADAIALYLLVDGMHDLNTEGVSTPKPHPTFKQVASVFGNLALAYGAGIVIPALQRDHSDPTRMPRIIYVTLAIISTFFMIVAITGVSAVGCQIPGNLFCTSRLRTLSS